MSTPTERPRPPPPRPSLGTAIALIVVGLVIFVPSGLCTGFLVFTPLVESLSNPRLANETSMAGIALIIGGPFVFGGGALLWFGVKRLSAYFEKSDEG